MKTTLKLALGLSVPALLLADISPKAPMMLGFTREAAALVGLPFTPVSVAGAARRTTRRVVAVETTAVAASSAAAASAAAASAAHPAPAPPPPPAPAAAHPAPPPAPAAAAPAPPPAGAPPIGSMVAALPAGCVSAPISGVQYFLCGGVYYRPAFQSNNLVYVVVQP
jgi:hypothetical protein